MILAKKLFLIGMTALLTFNLAQMAHRWVHPSTGFGRGLFEGMTWTLFAVAVACLLWSVRLKSRLR